MTAGHHAKGLNGAGWRRVPAALDDLELPRGLHVAYPTVLSNYYDRMMGDDRSCIWDMYVVERVQLTAITLLADLAGGRMQPHLPSLGQGIHPNDRGSGACVQCQCHQPHPRLVKAEGCGDSILPVYRGPDAVYPYLRTLRTGAGTGRPSR